MQPTVHIVILAAGASSRMLGRDKLLEPVAGHPILRHVAETAIGTGCPVVVMLPPASPRHLVLDNLPVTSIDVPDANLGMSRSLSRAATLLSHQVPPDTPDGLMVLPADMPGFTIGALTAMVAAFRNAPTLILRATDASRKPGHPATFPRDLWPELAALEGDEGGRSVLHRHQARLRLIPLPGDMATLDLDTPADWAAYRTSGR